VSSSVDTVYSQRGPNAPAPFQKNSKQQTIIWDGKDEQGVYIDDKDRCTIRVSLGLKAEYERSFLWSPYRRLGGNRCAAGGPAHRRGRAPRGGPQGPPRRRAR